MDYVNVDRVEEINVEEINEVKTCSKVYAVWIWALNLTYWFTLTDFESFIC